MALSAPERERLVRFLEIAGQYDHDGEAVNALRLAGDAVVGLANELGLMVTITVWGPFGATIVQVQEGTDQIHANVRAGAIYSLSGTATGRVWHRTPRESPDSATIRNPKVFLIPVCSSLGAHFSTRPKAALFRPAPRPAQHRQRRK